MSLSLFRATALIPLLIPWAAHADFADVPKSSPQYQAIKFLTTKGIIQGYPDGTFRPEQQINRAEIAKMITVGAGALSSVCSFPDVPGSSWFFPHVCTAGQYNFMRGYPNGTFKPGSTINFVEAAKVLTKRYGNAQELMQYEAAAHNALWYAPYIKYLQDRRAMPPTVQKLDQPMVRGQVAMIIARLVLAQGGGIPPLPRKPPPPTSPPLPPPQAPSSKPPAGEGGYSVPPDADLIGLLRVEDLRARSFPSGAITIEEDVTPVGQAWKQYIFSYSSDGLKIYGLMSVPVIAKPAGGFPVLVLVHGGVDPKKYDSREAIKDMDTYFAEHGYLVLKPDLRGHGNSEGIPAWYGSVSPYGAEYAIDVLNLMSSVGSLPDAHASRVVYLGHSMGATIGTWVTEVSPTLAAAALLSGVPPTPEEWWDIYPQRAQGYLPKTEELKTLRGNIDFIKTPLHIRQGTADETITPQFSQSFYDAVKAAGKEAELVLQEGADHKYSGEYRTPMFESVHSFFIKYLSY